MLCELFARSHRILDHLTPPIFVLFYKPTCHSYSPSRLSPPSQRYILDHELLCWHSLLISSSLSRYSASISHRAFLNRETISYLLFFCDARIIEKLSKMFIFFVWFYAKYLSKFNFKFFLNDELINDWTTNF